MNIKTKKTEKQAETLLQNRFGTSFSYSGEKKITINGEFSLYQNKFDGDALSPVAFQNARRITARKKYDLEIVVAKNLTEFLDININYLGRKPKPAKPFTQEMFS
jgi:hypothetical protein